MIEGVDYSGKPPGSAALKAAGKKFACRYLASDARGLTPAEIADLKAGGIALVLIYETDGLGFRNGEAPGRLDALAAQAQIVRLGLPLDSPVYFTVDDQFNPQDGPGFEGYLRAVSTALTFRRTGIYGPLAAIEYAKEHLLANYFWQTSGWSGVPPIWSPGNHLEQYAYNLIINGTNCDATRALADNYGQINTPAPKPPAPPITYPEGLDDGILSGLFGRAQGPGGVIYAYNPAGAVTQLWAAAGAKTGRYPALVNVEQFDTRLYFHFNDGTVLWRPNDHARVRWIVPPA